MRNGSRVINASNVIRAQLIGEADVLSHSYQELVKPFLKSKRRYGINRKESKQICPHVADFARVTEGNIHEV
jgi:hypothetical protein